MTKSKADPNLIKRLKDYLESHPTKPGKPMSVRALEKLCGLGETTIQSILDGGSKNPRKDILEKIYAVIGNEAISPISSFAQKEAFNFFSDIKPMFPNLTKDQAWEFYNLLIDVIEDEMMKLGKMSLSPYQAARILRTEILGERISKRGDTHQ